MFGDHQASVCPRIYPYSLSKLLEGIDKTSLMQAAVGLPAAFLPTRPFLVWKPSRELLIYDVGETVSDLLAIS